MKTKFRTILFLFATLAVSVPAAHAQVNVTTSVFVGSPYVFRGVPFSSGWVFQPTIAATYGGLSVGYFGNIDPKSGLVNNKVHVNESDLFAAYNLALGNAAVGVGYTFYTFPGYVDDELALNPSQEFFGSVAYTAGPVTPSLFAAYDFDENDNNALDGFYGEAKLGYGLDVGGQVYSLAAALGLDGGYILPDGETALSHVALTAGTGFSAGSISISPMLGFQVSLDEVYQNINGDTFFYGGFTVGL
jgi:hypothetical protein